jgi:hypothetical protein
MNKIDNSKYCNWGKCRCGKKKSWNVSDKDCGVFRAHGGHIVSAKNRAKGKFKNT